MSPKLRYKADTAENNEDAQATYKQPHRDEDAQEEYRKLQYGEDARKKGEEAEEWQSPFRSPNKTMEYFAKQYPGHGPAMQKLINVMRSWGFWGWNSWDQDWDWDKEWDWWQNWGQETNQAWEQSQDRDWDGDLKGVWEAAQDEGQDAGQSSSTSIDDSDGTAADRMAAFEKLMNKLRASQCSGSSSSTDAADMDSTATATECRRANHKRKRSCSGRRSMSKGSPRKDRHSRTRREERNAASLKKSADRSEKKQRDNKYEVEAELQQQQRMAEATQLKSKVQNLLADLM
eukprot:gnl/TRDRNA2_/TRDRNA2_169856_c1_seq1.p1 gnl/TRDRNA2_/TRDRNA2_169856_c1~~gnl/TRDRNA2_/TRDRNA2_169856_c1_seq1.p1  ORF type:complete len:289 (+),score=55.64 gnl/TRDRNA2_/TRDRNA2_169856_c1_seq1:41-907(+)